MFCSNCGKEMGEGMAFCPECGAPNIALRPASPQQQPVQQQPIQQSVQRQPVRPAPAPVRQMTPQPVQRPVQAPVQPPVQPTAGQASSAPARQTRPVAPGQSYTVPGQQTVPAQAPRRVPGQNGDIRQQGAGAFYGQPAPQPAPGKKKKKGGPVALAVILILVVGLVAVLALNFGKVKNSFMSSFSSPRDYYLMVEKQSMDDFANTASNLYGTFVSKNTIIAGGKEDLTTTVKLSPAVRELLQSQTKMDMSWMDSVTVGVNFAEDGDRASGKLSFKLNDSEIFTGDFYLDPDSSSIYARIDQLSPDYFRMDADNLGSKASALTEGLSSVPKDDLPEDKTVKELINRYTKVILDAIGKDAVKRESGQLTEGSVTEKGLWLTVELTGNDFITVGRAILTEARDDKELYNLLRLANEGDADMSWEEFVEDIDKGLAELNEANESGDGARMRVFVSKDGEIHGREIEIGDQRLVYSFPRNGGNFAYRLEVIEDEETVSLLTGSGKDNGTELSGDFFTEEEGSIKVEKLDRKKLKKGEIVGRFTVISSASSASDSIAMSVLSSMNVAIDADYGPSGGKVALSFLSGEEEQIAIEVNTKSGPGGSVNVVSNGKELNEYARGIDMDSVKSDLKERLRKAGMPDELLGSLLD